MSATEADELKVEAFWDTVIGYFAWIPRWKKKWEEVGGGGGKREKPMCKAIKEDGNSS